MAKDTLTTGNTPYITKDSGNREGFDSGAVRDTQIGKPRYDLIPPAPLARLAELYARGAEKYSEHNWAKGMPTSRILASLVRHIEAYRAGERTEDHLAAVAWNAFAIMHFEGSEWDDFYDWTPGLNNSFVTGTMVYGEIPIGAPKEVSNGR